MSLDLYAEDLVANYEHPHNRKICPTATPAAMNTIPRAEMT